MNEIDIRQKTARRQVQEFERNFGRSTLHLAYHAALPVVLNSELLHLLRINFLFDLPEPLPYTAETDLLLSPLCHEIGDGLYEIDTIVRNELLQGLLIEYGPERLRQIAKLLWQYTNRNVPWGEQIRLERAQQLTALNFLAPKKARQWIDEAEVYSGQTLQGERDWFVAMRGEISRRDENILGHLMYKAANRGYLTTDDVLAAFPEAENDLASLEEIFVQLINQGIELYTDSEEAEKETEWQPEEKLLMAIFGERLDQQLDANIRTELRQLLESLLATLTAREARILYLRFGFRDDHSYTLQNVAERLGLTIEQIQQIEEQSLRKLRHPSRSRLLRGYLGPVDKNVVHLNLRDYNISPAFYVRMRNTLLNCGSINSDSLKTIFLHPKLKAWSDSYPQVSSMIEQVDAIIAFLINKRLSTNEGGLVLLFEVLSEQIASENKCYEHLIEVAEELKDTVQTLDNTRSYLVRVKNEPQVYLISENIKYLIPDGPTLEAIATWNDVAIITQDELQGLENGIEIPSVAQGETETVEFKIPLGQSPSELAKNIAAFANSKGGTIMFGVTDDNRIVGVTDFDSQRHSFYNLVEQARKLIEPSIDPVIKEIKLDKNRNLILIFVPSSESMHTVEGRVYVRVGNRREERDTFEELVADIFRRAGANVQQKYRLADKEVDLLVEWTPQGDQTQRLSIEVKNIERPVDVEIVNSVGTNIDPLREANEVDAIILVSKSGFTQAARAEAQKLGINLFDLDSLKAALSKRRSLNPQFPLSDRVQTLPTVHSLSERQSRILSFLRTYTLDNGFPPTIREIGKSVDISSTSAVNYNLDALQRAGYIYRDRTVPRGIRLAEGISELIGSYSQIRVPLLGEISTDRPIQVPEGSYDANIDFIEISSNMINDDESIYALRVRGDSMSDAMISDGDVVLLKHARAASNGDLVAAWLIDSEEVTLKRYYVEEGLIRLQSDNPLLDPIYVPRDKIEIQGKVVGVIRTIE